MMDMHQEASRLDSCGLCVIPIGRNKLPAVRWKSFQSTRPDSRQIWDWWYGRDDLGIGIVLGSASKNVFGRDFDSQESFDKWLTTHRSLAKELPITRTRRGGHVYFRSSPMQTAKFDDGEIRSDGSYLIAPPTLHPSGIRYSWLNPFRDLPKLIDPVEEGLCPKAEKCNPRNQIIALGNSLAVRGDQTLEEAVANAIRETLPKKFGQRNDLLFEFARRLRAIPELNRRSASEVLKYAEDWFREALPNISTKEWSVTRRAFVSAWPRIKVPWSNGVLTACLAKADTEPPSVIAARYANDPVTMRLVGLCERLQSYWGESPFFLSTDDCELFGLKHKMQLHRRITRLSNDGVLRRVSTGNSIQGRASEYFFLPHFEQGIRSTSGPRDCFE